MLNCLQRDAMRRGALSFSPPLSSSLSPTHLRTELMLSGVREWREPHAPHCTAPHRRHLLCCSPSASASASAANRKAHCSESRPPLSFRLHSFAFAFAFASRLPHVHCTVVRVCLLLWCAPRADLFCRFGVLLTISFPDFRLIAYYFGLLLLLVHRDTVPLLLTKQNRCASSAYEYEYNT